MAHSVPVAGFSMAVLEDRQRFWPNMNTHDFTSNLLQTVREKVPDISEEESENVYRKVMEKFYDISRDDARKGLDEYAPISDENKR